MYSLSIYLYTYILKQKTENFNAHEKLKQNSIAKVSQPNRKKIAWIVFEYERVYVCVCVGDSQSKYLSSKQKPSNQMTLVPSFIR